MSVAIWWQQNIVHILQSSEYFNSVWPALWSHDNREQRLFTFFIKILIFIILDRVLRQEDKRTAANIWGKLRPPPYLAFSSANVVQGDRPETRSHRYSMAAFTVTDHVESRKTWDTRERGITTNQNIAERFFFYVFKVFFFVEIYTWISSFTEMTAIIHIFISKFLRSPPGNPCSCMSRVVHTEVTRHCHCNRSAIGHCGHLPIIQ